MSSIPQTRMRTHALAAAIAVVVSIATHPASAAGRVHLDGLESAEQHDRFIVKYKDDSSPRNSPEALAKALDRAARAVPPHANGRALDVVKLRRLAIDAELIKVDRKLDSAEAEVLMRQFAADPDVELTSATGTYTITTNTVPGGFSYRLHERINGGNWVWRHTQNYGLSRTFYDRLPGTYDYRAWVCNSEGCGPYSAVETVVVTP